MRLASLVFVLSITNAKFLEHNNYFKQLENIKNNFLTNNPQITFFKKVFKKHTKISIEANYINSDYSDFGKTFTFSPLDDLCNTGFEKNIAKLCLKYHPSNWNCVYDNCVSLSREIPYYVKFVLPSIYNKTVLDT